MAKKIKNYNLHTTAPVNSQKEINLNRLSLFIIITWTLLLIFILAWNCLQIKEGIEEEAIIALRIATENDLIFRTWATKHGGIYVPITPETQPNPYLQHIENHTLTTSANTELTLLNPAYIMRQVYQIRYDNSGIYNRLISLNAINPSNSADLWEAESLKKLETNINMAEITDITDFGGQSFVRLIQPFFIEDGCLKCHGHQGYQVGDLYGGISASIAFAPYAKMIYSRQIALLPGYILIWLVGLAGIGWFTSRLKSLTFNLEEKEAHNQATLQAIPDMLIHYNTNGVILNAKINNHVAVSQIVTDANLIGQNIKEILSPDLAEQILTAINEVVTTGKMQLIEYSYLLNQEQFYFEERIVLLGDDEVIAIVRDVTQNREAEAKLEYLGYHDVLTGLNNRNYFQEELARLNGSEEYPISIILADINGLKLINDALGHTVGDELLISCAQVLKDSIRSSDILARVGGDEFVIILPYTNKQIGQNVMQRIHDKISKHNKQAPHLPLSISLGLATAVNKDIALISTYQAADDLMYQEKQEKGLAGKHNMVKLLMSAHKSGKLSGIDHKRLKEAFLKMDKGS